MRYFEDLRPGHTETIDAEYELTEAAIISFAREWDPQLFHVDPERARLTPMGGLTASSAHLYAIAARLLIQVSPPIAGIASLRHEMKIPNPGRPGDVLQLDITVSERRASASRPDRGLVTMNSELRSSEGKVVLQLQSLMMIFRRLKSLE
jgi:acyl dehydratase